MSLTETQIEQVNTLSSNYRDAVYNDPEHKTFDVTLDHKEYGTMFFTYLCDGTDDCNSQVSKEVGDAWRKCEFNVSEYVEPEVNLALLAEQIRTERNKLLTACDYFIIPDYPASEDDKQKVREYRQALRDITSQPEFPLNVVWPEKPACLP